MSASPPVSSPISPSGPSTTTIALPSAPASSSTNLDDWLRCPFEGCTFRARHSARDLRTHWRTHTGEKPYMCSYPGCDYRAARRDGLKRHERGVHADERPLTCTYDGCPYRARNPAHMKSHLHTHERQRGLRCNVKDCGYLATRAVYMEEHMRLAHAGMAMEQAIVVDAENDPGSRHDPPQSHPPARTILPRPPSCAPVSVKAEEVDMPMDSDEPEPESEEQDELESEEEDERVNAMREIRAGPSSQQHHNNWPEVDRRAALARQRERHQEMDRHIYEYRDLGPDARDRLAEEHRIQRERLVQSHLKQREMEELERRALQKRREGERRRKDEERLLAEQLRLAEDRQLAEARVRFYRNPGPSSPSETSSRSSSHHQFVPDPRAGPVDREKWSREERELEEARKRWREGYAANAHTARPGPKKGSHHDPPRQFKSSGSQPPSYKRRANEPPSGNQQMPHGGNMDVDTLESGFPPPPPPPSRKRETIHPDIRNLLS